MRDEGATVGLDGEGTATRPRGRPREKPSAFELGAPVVPEPGRLISGTTPYRILARIKKTGPMSYHEISAYITGSRTIRRDKYVDPALQGLRKRGYIDLSKVKGAKGRWMITQAGRLAMRHALPNPADVQRLREAELERSKALHQAHVALQRKLGIPEALIHEPLPGATYTAAV